MLQFDLTNRLNEAKGSYDIFTLIIASVDKYRNQAEVYSKESSYAPVLVATVNGKERTFYVKKDATLQGGATRLGNIRFSGILSEDAENGTKLISNLMSGKYAIELDFRHKINTDRVDGYGVNWPTYVTMQFGLAGEGSGSINSGFSKNLVELRLYNTYMNIIRYENTQADGIRNDVNSVSVHINSVRFII